MPELRKNELTGEWVAIAEERAKRPVRFQTGSEKSACPFCPGNEHMTPPPDLYQSADKKIRVIVNKYPILIPEAGKDRGVHEVVIDTDRHEQEPHTFSRSHFAAVLTAIRHRITALEADPRVKYIQVFKNQGAAAGASQPHSHWQIVAVPFVPQTQTVSYTNASAALLRDGRCLLCETVARQKNSAVVDENETFLAYCDAAARFSYEIHIAPKRHTARFKELSPAALDDLAAIFLRCLRALAGLIADFSYNICFMDAPVNADTAAYTGLSACSHFYIRIIPRIGRLAGFELSTNCYINPVPPEKAAALIRARLEEEMVSYGSFHPDSRQD